MKSARLILADIHQLEPFSVRSYQFSCRAKSFARFWPGPVELWLPGPRPDSGALAGPGGSDSGGTFDVQFGPSPYLTVWGRRFACRAWFRRWCKRRIVQLRNQGEACLFYFRTLRLAHHLQPILRRCSFKYAFEPHELFFESSRHPARLKRMEESVYSQAAQLFPITQALQSSLREKLTVATPALVSPLGHDGNNFALGPYDPQAPPSFLYIGSLHRWKGLEMAFQATAGLGVPFDVVGDAGGLQRCREFCDSNRFTHVTFHGQVPPEKTGQFYRPGTICLLPLSNQEIARSYTSPLKLFEYLAAGRPIVAADLPTVRELVRDGEQALLLPVEDVAAWRRGLEAVLADRPRAARLAQNARRLAEACTWEQRAKLLVERLLTLT